MTFKSLKASRDFHLAPYTSKEVFGGFGGGKILPLLLSKETSFKNAGSIGGLLPGQALIPIQAD